MKTTFSLLMNHLYTSLKGLIMVVVTFFDIMIYSRLKFSPLLMIRQRSSSAPPSQPAPAIVSLKPNQVPEFLPLTETHRAQDDPDPKNYWVEGDFYTPYNLTGNLFYFLNLKQQLKLLGINEQNCHLLSFSVKTILPYPMTQDAQPQLIKHFAKFSSHRDMQGIYRLNKFIRITYTNVWQLWGNRKLQEELRQTIFTSYGITPRPPIKKATQVLLISRGPAYFHKKDNVTIRRILNEETLLAFLQEKLEAENIQVRSYRMEDVPMKEQLQLVNQTDILVGMHGAGLGHTLFLPPNGALLEIFPCHFTPHYSYTFYMMALGRGLHYARYIQPFIWREQASFAFKGKKQRQPKHYPLLISGDYSYIPPQKILRKILKLAHRIKAYK